MQGFIRSKVKCELWSHPQPPHMCAILDLIYRLSSRKKKIEIIISISKNNKKDEENVNTNLRYLVWFVFLFLFVLVVGRSKMTPLSTEGAHFAWEKTKQRRVFWFLRFDKGKNSNNFEKPTSAHEFHYHPDTLYTHIIFFITYNQKEPP